MKLIEGKTYKQWAEHFGMKLGSVYIMHHRGNLIPRIKGTYKRKTKPKKLLDGKTVDEWVEILKIGNSSVKKYHKLGLLAKIQSGEFVPGNTKHLVRGRTLKYWGDKLGITRERARQLDEDGYLEARIDGAGPRQANNSKHMQKCKARREEAVKQYIPGEKVIEFAKRIGVGYSVALEWLNKEGVKRTKQGDRKKSQKYKGKIEDEKLQCGTCKYFMAKKRYKCELGKFALDKKWGGCSKHEL